MNRQRAIPASLQQALAKNAGAAWSAGSVAERRLLHRQVYVQLRLQDLQQQLASDGSNGLALAKQVREELPTESKVAAELEAREVAWQLSRADQLDREGLISACGLLLQLERRAEAEQLRAAWLRRCRWDS